MNKVVFSNALGLAGLLVASLAQAADLSRPAFKATPAARASDWTGFYVGLQAGGGWGRAEQTDSSPFSSGTYDLSGGLAGVTWGYNWQVGSTVVGFEGDAAWSNIRGSTDGASGFNGPCIGNHCEATLQWFGTNRLRLGHAFGRWLPYVTGGMAWGYINGKEGPSAFGTGGSGSEFHYGWTGGGGVEAMIDPHWSAKVEYLYADLRDGGTFTDLFGGGGMVVESEKMKVHIVRAGLNYKFDPGQSLLPFLPPSPGPSAGPWNWSGFYVGINYGGGAGRASQSDSLFDRGIYDVSGQIIGGTIGYNWQRNNLVYGLEGDLDYSWIKGSTSGLVDATTPPCGVTSVLSSCDTKLQWLGTARVRIGVTWDRLLPYVTSGLAVGSLKSSEGDPGALLAGSGSVTRAGWTAGAGIEARIDNRWSTKVEYLYVDLGSGTVFNEPFIGGTTMSENVSFRTHIWRSGLNYRFN